MIVIKARTLLKYTTAQLWEFLSGNFRIRFDNGEELETNYRETLYSSYAWDFIREFPNTPILPKHHLRGFIGKDLVGATTHLKLLGNVAWSVNDAYFKNDEDGLRSRDYLARRIYELSNEMYNDLIIRLEKYVVSLDISDFIEVLENPKIVELKKNLQPTQESIQFAYKAIMKIIKSPEEMGASRISGAIRSGVSNPSQVMQCVGFRGYGSDIDSSQFPVPIMRGFAEGLRSLHDHMVESRSASRALFNAKAPLQETEYFSRRLQLICQTVQNLHYGDCGSTKYLTWKIKPPEYGPDGEETFNGDLKRLEGKYFLDEETKGLKAIKASDKHLEGKTLKIRSVIAGCACKDPYGVCSTCFGELSFSIPEGTNIGQLCSTHMSQQASQNVLSTKHLDNNAIIDKIVLPPSIQPYLKVSSSGSSYLISDRVKHKNVKIIVNSFDAQGLTDIDIVDDVTELSIPRIAEIDEMTMSLNDGKLFEDVPIPVSVGRRKASFTYDFLRYIKKKRWSTDEKGNYVFDMKDWDFSKEFLVLPLKQYNMSDHANEIARLLEGSMTKLRESGVASNPLAVIVELCDLVNQKLKVNLAILEITLYGACVVSMKENDYSLPKAWTTQERGVAEMTMFNRSLSSAMAYEFQKNTILNASSFFNYDRVSTPMDVFIKPKECIDDRYDPC